MTSLELREKNREISIRNYRSPVKTKHKNLVASSLTDQGLKDFTKFRNKFGLNVSEAIRSLSNLAKCIIDPNYELILINKNTGKKCPIENIITRK